MGETLPKLTLVLGGSRSGKSRFAQELPGAKARVLFWATGIASDPEMKKRIADHREGRPARWTLLEEPQNLLQGLKRAHRHQCGIVLLDSLTTWAGNMMAGRASNGKPLEHLRAFLGGLKKSEARWIIVSDEVGMSVVPATPSGRIFRDLLGDINQKVAAVSNRVYLVSAGIPLRIK